MNCNKRLQAAREAAGLDEPEISYETALAVIVAQGRQEEAVQALGRME